MSFRRLSLVALLLATALDPAAALAEPSIAASAVTIQIGNRTGDGGTGSDIDLISTADQPKMFNLANCECKTPRTVKVTISGASAFAGQKVHVHYFVGPNCSDTTSRTQSCHELKDVSLDDFSTQAQFFDIDGSRVVSPTSPTCYPSGSKSGANSFWVFIDWNGDQAYDDTNDTIQKLELSYDVEPPGVVRNVVATSGEQALNVKWTVPADADIESIQVLCSRGILPVFAEGTYTAGYESAAGVCSAGGDGGVDDGGVEDDGGTEQDGGTKQEDAGTTAVTDAGAATDAGAVTGITASGGLASVDPAYVCSGILGSTTSSARIARLQNGVTYYVAVVAIDKSGNASPVYTMVSGTPQEVLDFWEDYKQQGGTATGCAFGQRVPVGWIGVGLAGVSLALVLATMRRRRGRGDGGGGAR